MILVFWLLHQTTEDKQIQDIDSAVFRYSCILLKYRYSCCINWCRYPNDNIKWQETNDNIPLQCKDIKRKVNIAIVMFIQLWEAKILFEIKSWFIVHVQMSDLLVMYST